MSDLPLHSLSTTFIALDDQSRARPLPVTNRFWSDLTNGRLGEFSRLVSLMSYNASWSTWERHPAGEEVVCLLEGSVTLLLEMPEGQEEINLTEPGQYVLVPPRTWHTARVERQCTMLFITPGEGTENRPA